MILDSASPSLGIRQSCAETGFHATLFQFAAFTYCLVHHRTLRDTSGFDQNQPPQFRVETSFGGLIRPIIPGSIARSVTAGVAPSSQVNPGR